uniref:RNA-dependent RNA polymerase n=1 Tax=Wenling thamnaconus striatus hepevirus TaxID=2116400 RepID=A0A2P1GMS4_9VIRU|nr:RNA-dependent RNA polymerase [Wenling thamnaconus striatus hepevirus]
MYPDVTPDLYAVTHPIVAPETGTLVLTDIPFTYTKHRKPPVRVVGRPFWSTDRVGTVRCMTARYAHQNKARSGGILWDALKTVLGPVSFQLDFEESFVFFANMMGSLNEKKTWRKIVDELRWLHDMPNNVQIDFFVKTFTKVASHDAGCDKAGQGVSAWPKEYVYCFGVVARALERALVKVLPSSFFFASGLNDQEMAPVLCAWATGMGKSFHCINDFSRFDSTQGQGSLDFEIRLYRALGMPDDLAEMYALVRRKWSLSIRGARFSTGHMRNSGEAFTMLGNSVYNLAALCVMFPDMVGCCVKGDDSIIALPSEKSIEGASERALSIGALAKVETPLVCDFISYLITSFGVFPFAHRLLGRLVCKPHEDSNLVQALQDSYLAWLEQLGVLRAPRAHLWAVVESQAAHVSVEEAECVIATLVAFSRGADLSRYTYSPLVFQLGSE